MMLVLLACCFCCLFVACLLFLVVYLLLACCLLFLVPSCSLLVACLFVTCLLFLVPYLLLACCFLLLACCLLVACLLFLVVCLLFTYCLPCCVSSIFQFLFVLLPEIAVTLLLQLTFCRYYMTSFEAAVEYVQSDHVQLTSRHPHPAQAPSPVRGPPPPLRLRSNSGAMAEETRQFFQLVTEGGMEKLREVLEKAEQEKSSLQALFCHPLCDCKKCIALIDK